MELVDWDHRVLIFSILCHGVLLWRLWSQKLAGIYLFLTVFLCAEAVQNLIFLPFRDRASPMYGLLFLLTTPILWILAYLVVLELYRLVLQEYPGIASVGRKAVNWAMGLSLVIGGLYTIPDLRSTKGHFPILHIYAIFERSSVLALLLFLVLIQLFLFHYKLRLSRNGMVYATGYAIYFGVGIAQDIIWASLGFHVADTVSLWIVAIAGVILLGGAALLNKEGEARVEVGPPDEDSDRTRLQQQLAEMNRLLVRAARGRG